MREASKPTSVRFVCPICREEVTQQVIRKMAGKPDRVVGVCTSEHYAYYGEKL